MKLEVTELGPIKRALKIEVSEDEVNQHFARAYAELNRQVRIPGFRPGKAPLALLEKRFAKEVEEDVIRRLVPDYYGRAINQTGLVPVLVEVPPLERVKVKKNAPFSFTATVEIKPTIELRDYRPPNPISLKPDKRTVTDEQIDQTLGALQDQQAQLHAAPAGTTLAEGDYAILDVDGSLDGAPLEGASKAGHLHKIGSKASVLGLDVDAQLTGKHEGDTVEIPQPYPATHPDQRLAGRTVVFHLKIAAVKQKKLPPLDDEFAKDCGAYNSLTELKDKVRSEMERALKRDVEDGYKDQIVKRLVETHHFEVPEALVEREVNSMLRQHLESRRRQRGQADLQELAGRPDELKKLRDEFLPEAQRRVKVGLILEAVAEKERLTVDDEDLQAEYARLGSSLKLAPEEIRRMIEGGGEDAIDNMRGRLLAEKALDFVYRHAVIQG